MTPEKVTILPMMKPDPDLSPFQRRWIELSKRFPDTVGVSVNFDTPYGSAEIVLTQKCSDQVFLIFNQSPTQAARDGLISMGFGFTSFGRPEYSDLSFEGAMELLEDWGLLDR